MTSGISVAGMTFSFDGLASSCLSVDEVLLDRVLQNVRGGLTGVHIQASDAVGVVVVEHQPLALLVGVVEVSEPGPGSLVAPAVPRGPAGGSSS